MRFTLTRIALTIAANGFNSLSCRKSMMHSSGCGGLKLVENGREGRMEYASRNCGNSMMIWYKVSARSRVLFNAFID